MKNMRMYRRPSVAGIALLIGILQLAGQPAAAAPLTWYINSSQSKISLAIPDQGSNLDNLSISLRVRNQSTASNGNNVWNVGNSAPIYGFIESDYITGSNGTIEFLGGSHFIAAHESGNYRPNPAQYSTPLNPDGTASGGTFTGTGTSAAAYAGRFRGVYSGFTGDMGYFAMSEINFDLDSAPLPITGTNFVANTASFGISTGLIALDGIAFLVSPSFFPDAILEFSDISGTNQSLTGSITNSGNSLQLIMPISVPVQFNIDGVPLNATLSGTIVAYAMPEPSTFALVGTAAVVGLTIASRGRFRRAKR